jgi:hypothetical protein
VKKLELKRNWIIGKNRPGTKLNPQSITIHETANTDVGANAEAHRNYAQNNDRSVSYHWVVDDRMAIQVIPETEIAWHAGAKQGNETSLSIEICENRDGDRQKRYENTAWLAAYLLHKHRLPIDRMVTHKSWSGKNCPRNLLKNWTEFRSDVSGQLATLAQEKTHILGSSVVEPEQMSSYLKKHNPDAPNLVDVYFQMEKKEGVRADVAFSQSILETNFWRFGGLVRPEQHNYAGLGATGPENRGLSFKTPFDGIMAQGRHLRLYAEYIPELNDKTVDPRGLPEHLLGSAPFVEDLSGKWATDPNYGNKIVNILNEIKKMPVSTNEHWAIPELKKLKERRIILQDHDPEEVVKFGELATMLNRVLDLIYKNKAKK